MEADVEKLQEQLMATLLPFQVRIFHTSKQRSSTRHIHEMHVTFASTARP